MIYAEKEGVSKKDVWMEIERLKEARIEMENMLKIEKEEERERIEMGKEDMNRNENENGVANGVVLNDEEKKSDIQDVEEIQ
jgi:hypothetical protein